MTATRVYFERKFVVGMYSLEKDETVESAEEFVMQKLYEVAGRERKRRWGMIEHWANENRAHDKEVKARIEAEKKGAV